MITLRDYQADIVNRGKAILKKHRMLYLAMEVRTGKTLTALSMCNGAKNVLFITKKIAIDTIIEDYDKGGFDYNLEVINYESLSKIPDLKWDVIVTDEAHGMGAFPKASKRAKDVKALIKKNPKVYHILLSGTPTPESYSQIYHQLWVNPNSPFKEYTNFYKWAHYFVKVRQKRIAHGRIVMDYSDANKQLVGKWIKHIVISSTQKDAGFKAEIRETILKVLMKESTYKTCNTLVKDLVVEDPFILADTPVKLQSKLHQLYSGTIKHDDGSRTVLDTSKAEFIKDTFKDKKIAIFYKFIGELECIKQVFGDDVCTDLDTFNTTDKHIALQIVSGREGISLREADALVFYNIDFSATSYWQGRDRMTTKNRLINNVYWIFSEGGIEEKIYKTVIKKKSYTNYYFKKDYLK